MLAPVLLALAAAFVLLFLLRVGGARRQALLARWPAVLLALAALFAAARGALLPGLALAAAAASVWVLWPQFNSARRNNGRPIVDREDAEACALLGVAPDASPGEIRRAYRMKMANAHPDRGGSHMEAARLTAARDRLLRNRWR